jgi:hypothetical protein
MNGSQIFSRHTEIDKALQEAEGFSLQLTTENSKSMHYRKSDHENHLSALHMDVQLLLIKSIALNDGLLYPCLSFSLIFSQRPDFTTLHLDFLMYRFISGVL